MYEHVAAFFCLSLRFWQGRLQVDFQLRTDLEVSGPGFDPRISKVKRV